MTLSQEEKALMDAQGVEWVKQFMALHKVSMYEMGRRLFFFRTDCFPVIKGMFAGFENADARVPYLAKLAITQAVRDAAGKGCAPKTWKSAAQQFIAHEQANLKIHCSTVLLTAKRQALTRQARELQKQFAKTAFSGVVKNSLTLNLAQTKVSADLMSDVLKMFEEANLRLSEDDVEQLVVDWQHAAAERKSEKAGPAGGRRQRTPSSSSTSSNSDSDTAPGAPGAEKKKAEKKSVSSSAAAKKMSLKAKADKPQRGKGTANPGPTVRLYAVAAGGGGEKKTQAKQQQHQQQYTKKQSGLGATKAAAAAAVKAGKQERRTKKRFC